MPNRLCLPLCMPWSSHGRLWYTALGAEQLRRSVSPDSTYDALAARAPSASSPELDIVEKDIGRTFPDRAEFHEGDSRQRLRRVLRAYALRHTYCQGMSYIAAMMLQHLPESESFWALAALVENFLPAGYFTDDLHGAYMDQHIAFGQFLPYRLPRLAAHLTAVDFPLTLIGVRWFLCLFAADLQPAQTANLWDFLFSHGSHMLFAVALALLESHEAELLSKPDVPEMFVAVRAIGSSPLPWSLLRASAHAFPSEADVHVARAAYQREIGAGVASSACLAACYDGAVAVGGSSLRTCPRGASDASDDVAASNVPIVGTGAPPSGATAVAGGRGAASECGASSATGAARASAEAAIRGGYEAVTRRLRGGYEAATLAVTGATTTAPPRAHRAVWPSGAAGTNELVSAELAREQSQRARVELEREAAGARAAVADVLDLGSAIEHSSGLPPHALQKKVRAAAARHVGAPPGGRSSIEESLRRFWSDAGEAVRVTAKLLPDRLGWMFGYTPEVEAAHTA